MAYSGCRTGVVDLTRLELPDQANELEYKEIYLGIARQYQKYSSLIDAVESIRIGIAPPVAFPTETVYGLGADATSEPNIAGIFAAKGRPSDNPLIVHVASKEHLERLTGEPLPEVYQDLVKEYWPGPLTILVPVPKHSVFAKNTHPGQDTIGFRVPGSKYARFFIAATGKPIAAPSANSSGKPSPTAAEHVMHDLNGKINFILDGGICDVGVESTVVDGLHDPPLILRPGGISQEELVAHGRKHGNNNWINTDVGYKRAQSSTFSSTPGTPNPFSQSHESDLNDEFAPRAPGMKYKHYAPHGQMTLICNSPEFVATTNRYIRQKLDLTEVNTSSTPETIAILTTTSKSFEQLKQTTTKRDDFSSQGSQEHHGIDPTIVKIAATATATTTATTEMAYRSRVHKIHIIHLGTTTKDIAHNLFAALRQCDDLGCHYIFAEAPSPPSPASLSLSEETTTTTITSDEEREDLKSVHRHYDAVIERMRKAAGEVIED